MRKKEEISIEIKCSFIETELRAFLGDLDKIRRAKSPIEIRRVSHLLKVALRNTGAHIKDIERISKRGAGGTGTKDPEMESGRGIVNRFSGIFSKDELETLSWLIADYVVRFKQSPQRLAIGRKLNEEIVEACKEIRGQASPSA